MGSLVVSGLSRLIRSFRNELAQQTLAVINKHGQREKETANGQGESSQMRPHSGKFIEVIKYTGSLTVYWDRLIIVPLEAKQSKKKRTNLHF